MTTTKAHDASLLVYVRRHLQFAWWSLVCFITLGTILETMHAFKIGWYLDESYETRRLMWTLSHAHGTLLSLVHVAFALTLYLLPVDIKQAMRLASPMLVSASVLLPGGFFLAGSYIHQRNLGLGIWLVPLGALALFGAVLVIAVGLMTNKNARVDSDSTAFESQSMSSTSYDGPPSPSKLCD